MLLSRVALAGNLLEVTRTLPRRGLGSKLQRIKWHEDSYWSITAVKPSIDGAHGKASGILTWKGEQQSEKPVRINGVLKKVWRSMGSKSLTWQEITKPTVETPAAAVAAT